MHLDYLIPLFRLSHLIAVTIIVTIVVSIIPIVVSLFGDIHTLNLYIYEHKDYNQNHYVSLKVPVTTDRTAIVIASVTSVVDA